MRSIDDAAAARANAHAEQRRQDTINALLAERRGYEQRDLPDRVRQVDEQLARHGYRPGPGTDAEGDGPPVDPPSAPAPSAPGASTTLVSDPDDVPPPPGQQTEADGETTAGRRGSGRRTRTES